jgi:hypothetical protein
MNRSSKPIAYLISLGALVVLTIGLYTFFAIQYSLTRELGGNSVFFPVLTFWPIPLVSTFIFYLIRTKKETIPKPGIFCLASFFIMYIVVYIYAMYTIEQYRLSHNIFDSGEMLGLHILLFLQDRSLAG